MASCLHLITLLIVVLGCSAQVLPPPGDDCCKRCPSGWTQYGNRCFRLHYSPLPMPDAELLCISEGGNLASYLNGAEIKFVNGLIKKVSGKSINTWTGLHDAIKEGVWFWTDGTKVKCKPWAKGEPNNYGKGEDCVELYPSGKFNDLACTYKRSFICTKSL